MKEIKTAPHARTPTAVLDIRFPKRPLMAKPIAGKSGMSQIRSKKFIVLKSEIRNPKSEVSRLPLHQINLVDVHRFLVLEHRNHDPKTHRGFRRSHRNNKDGEHLPGHLLQPVGEGNP